LRNLALWAALIWTPALAAETFVRPPADVDLIGEIRDVAAAHEDTLLDIARRYSIGQDEIVLANPAVDRWLPGEGTRVVVPSRYILPNAERRGLVLNVPEMRLYYYPPAQPGRSEVVQTYPASIGRMDWKTPLGKTKVVAKTKHPDWRPPESIRREHAAEGQPLPKLVPAGPDNPLGDYAIRLGLPGYLIHSTNKPYGVGMRVTHGCVRMYPEDIEVLFPEIPVDTPVQIVNQPIKTGWLGETLFVEIHPPLDENRADTNILTMAMDLVNAQWERRPFVLDAKALRQAISEQNGIPVAIGHTAQNPDSRR
jgi:L,D-transpeptidase ErfK/SrfK